MTKMTDYKYRKLRKMVAQTKGVGIGVKSVLLCALHDYYKCRSVPEIQLFEEGNRRCLIGAALHDKNMRPGKNEFGYYEDDWEDIAIKTFGINRKAANAIITGFDEVYRGHSKVSKLAHKVGVELGISYND